MVELLKNLYNYRELLKNNVKKEMRGKYKKSFLGVMWSFLNPLLQLAVYATIFPFILKNTQDNYVIFLCVALIPWTYFTTTITQSSSCIIVNGNILKKVYFPREIIPISIVTSATYNFLISTIIVILFVLFSGIGLTSYILFYPLILLIQYIMLLGFSFILSSVTVYLRDLEHLIGIFLMALFYGTPIVYSADSFANMPKAIASILNLNPMAHIINAYRDIFYYQQKPDIRSLLILLLISIIVCVLGYAIFNKLQKRFAEEL